MTRFIHDQLAKGILEETLALGGTVEVEVQLPAEVQRIDLRFTPSSTSPPAILGLLGKLASTITLFEPYRTAVNASQVRSCQQKLNALIAEQERQAKRKQLPRPSQQLPFLWILTPTASTKLLDAFGATFDPVRWPQGVYELPSGQRTGIIAIHQLPQQSDTLWLRLLGRDRVQQVALEELRSLSNTNPLQERVLELVYDSWAVLEARRRQAGVELDSEEKVLFMQLSGLYRKHIEEVRQAGRQEGHQEGHQEGQQEERRTMLESALVMRFGVIDAQRQVMIDSLMALPADESLPLLMQLSEAELIDRFGQT